jgi:signal transduction histidine kinase
VDFLATVLAATAAVELLSAVLFGFSYGRRRSEHDFGVAVLACLAAAVHTLGSALAANTDDPAAALLDDRVALLGLIAMSPLLVNFAMIYRGDRPKPAVLAIPYGIAGVFAVLDLLGRLQSPAAAAPHTPGLLGLARDAHAVAPLGLLGSLAYAGAALAAALALRSVASAFLSGRREALALVIGGTVLLATALNDLGVATGLLDTGYLIDAGLAAFVVGLATTPSARYAAVHIELDRSTKELRRRSRELLRSYEDLRVTQEELVKKEQLAVVGELAAVIAHEVRNPLAIIGNAVAGLRKASLSREDRDTLLSILDEEANRLNRLVTDLLRYARPVNVQRQHFSLSDLLDRTLALVARPHDTIKTELRVECAEGRVWGDANLLRQVFDNLVDNAVQAMGAAGALTVRLRAATQEGVDGLAVDITDTGEGMDTQVRSRARDPFFTTRPSGTGLGLAIVDRIVSAHDGNFVIESRAGEGTTVTVFLPHGSASDPPPRPRTPSRAPSEPPASERVVR